MIFAQRQQIILNYLDKNEIVTTAELCNITGSSITTTRRDLNTMHDEGLLIKTHGGAKKILQSVGDYLKKSEPSEILNIYSNSLLDDPYYNEKLSIAKYSVEFVKDGDVIFLGAGVTCMLLAQEIKDVKNLTIISTSIDIVNILRYSSVSILLLGGTVHLGKNYIETLGEYTIGVLNNMYFDKVFFTVNGVDLNFGYSISNRNQIQLYKYLLEHSKASYILINSAKFGHIAFTKLFRMNELNNVVLNTNTPEPYLDYYNQNNINTYVTK